MTGRTSIPTLGCLIFIILGAMLFYKVCVEPAEVFLEDDSSTPKKESVFIQVTEPANLWRYGFKKKWPVKKVPGGTEFEIISQQVWQSPRGDLQIRYYQVSHQGLTGWISEHSCKVINK